MNHKVPFSSDLNTELSDDCREKLLIFKLMLGTAKQ